MTTTRGNELLNTNFSRCNDVALQASLRDLAARCARGLHESFGPIEQRVQGKPGAQCTRSLVCKKQTHERSNHRFSGSSPAFPAQWFYGLLRDLPGETSSFATVTSQITPQSLAPASGARTSRLRRPLKSRSSVATLASTASHRAFVTTRDPPLSSGETRGV